MIGDPIHATTDDRPTSVLVVLGTRPEAIKLAPVIAELRRHPHIRTRVCVTGQHREMLDPLLDLFDVRPDVDLHLMSPDQRLSALTALALERLDGVIERLNPDWVIVQGDTTTAMAAAIAAFQRRIRVGHVEAGLRTYDLQRPFPEEANRRIIDAIASAHFAPTESARANLIREGAHESSVHVTGNTVIDALLDVAGRPFDVEVSVLGGIPVARRLVLVTAHRRESFGSGLRDICLAVRDLVDAVEDIHVVFPVHLNPNVRRPVHQILDGHPRILLTAPLDYVELVWTMRRSTLILTDSGGIQEEAPTFGRPVLILRELTERAEAVDAGCARVVGTDRQRILASAVELLSEPVAYSRMAHAANPFGDGHASERIVRILLQEARSERAAAEPVAVLA